jgi:hypothetical protein
MHRQKALQWNEDQHSDQNVFEIEPVCKKIEPVENAPERFVLPG